MSLPNEQIAMRDVSKFYGEVLGVNRVDLVIEPGITGLVGPNGSGKSTLMNLVAGLLRPTRGEMSILGIPPSRPEVLFRLVGYCTQYDSFPAGMTGRQFLDSFLRVHGFSKKRAAELAARAIERVGLTEAADRKVAGYSKGMRQRIKLAQAICHEPHVMVLDEPLNGLDPMARVEVIALFRELAEDGLHVLLSSHILHEIDQISDRVIFLNKGYVVAEGEVAGVRGEMKKHPMQIFIRCGDPHRLASRVFEQDDVVEVKMHPDRLGLLVRTESADHFYLAFNQLVLEENLEIEAIGPADESVQAVYQYLVVDEEVAS